MLNQLRLSVREPGWLNSESRQNYSEEQVRQISQDIVSKTDKTVFAMHASRDIDRFKSFYEVAKKTNRKLVITPKTAYLLSKLLADDHLPVPDPLKDDCLKVYFKKKKSGKYDEKDYFQWERKFLGKMVDCKYVHKNGRKLIMDLDFFQFAELIDIKPEEGSHLIHSMSEPFSEEDIEDQVMHNWLVPLQDTVPPGTRFGAHEQRTTRRNGRRNQSQPCFCCAH